MLQQMLQDDREEEVRESVVRSLAVLFGYMDDADRYNKVLHSRALNSSPFRQNGRHFADNIFSCIFMKE